MSPGWRNRAAPEALMSGATVELTHGGLDREQDETIQQLWWRRKTLSRVTVGPREYNEKSLSQL
jgi:hypothetical protein